MPLASAFPSAAEYSAWSLRALVRSVVRDAYYRADHGSSALAVPTKLLTAEQLSSAVEALTGFRWTNGGRHIFDSDTVGLRTLAGGADGLTVTRSTHSPTATMVLVGARLAEAAASHVVASDRARAPEQRALLSLIDFSETPSTRPDPMIAQIQDLHLRFFGRRIAADSEEVAANLELWSALEALYGDPEEAWAGLISALLRDPDFVLY